MAIASLSELVSGVLQGRLISFPTDTVPALAATPDRADLIFAAKQRGQDKPLILMAATAEALWPYVTGNETEWTVWNTVVARHWPGALTLVLPASPLVPPQMHPLAPNTIGVRVPNHPVAQEILQQTGPLATTSANLSGQPALLSLAEIATQFPEVLTLEPATPPASYPGLPSTVVRWTGSDWEILRQGAVQLL